MLSRNPGLLNYYVSLTTHIQSQELLSILQNTFWVHLDLSISLSRSKSRVKLFNRVCLFAIPWTVAYQAPPSMEFSRQKYWSALPFPSPGDLPNSEIKPRCPALQVDSFPSEPPRKLMNTGVGSLPLLQRIFPTQESTQGLSDCRQILYQLSYQGSPWREHTLLIKSIYDKPIASIKFNWENLKAFLLS